MVQQSKQIHIQRRKNTVNNDPAERHWFLTTTLIIHSPFLLPSFIKREDKRGIRLTKVVVKNNAFLLDPVNNTNLNPATGDQKFKYFNTLSKVIQIYSSKNYFNFQKFLWLGYLTFLLLYQALLSLLFHYYGNFHSFRRNCQFFYWRK